MENQNNKLSLATTPPSSIALNRNEQALVKEIYNMNLLTNQPLTATQMEDWARAIQRVSPDITPEQVHFAIQEMMMGVIAFDYRKGIQNLFNAIKLTQSPYYKKGEGIVC